MIFLVWGAFYIYGAADQDEIFIKDFKTTWATIFDWLDKLLVIPTYGLGFSVFLCEPGIDCTDGKKIITYLLNLEIILFIITQNFF
jgi:hypothetical protein